MLMSNKLLNSFFLDIVQFFRIGKPWGILVFGLTEKRTSSTIKMDVRKSQPGR
jgi:hypothetical protein